jgi:hypothetical protein
MREATSHLGVRPESRLGVAESFGIVLSVIIIRPPPELSRAHIVRGRILASVQQFDTVKLGLELGNSGHSRRRSIFFAKRYVLLLPRSTKLVVTCLRFQDYKLPKRRKDTKCNNFNAARIARNEEVQQLT